MITATDKESIKNIIGYRCAPLIQEELNTSKEFNKGGQSYSTSHITNVMNGESHDVIEAAIYRVVDKRLALQQKRENLLHKKSAAGTADV